MRQIDFGGAYYEVVKHLKEQIANAIDVNPKHINILYVEGEGFEFDDEDEGLNTCRKVTWRTVDWVDTTDENGRVHRERTYGEVKDSAWITVEDGEFEGTDTLFMDYQQFIEE